jgi:hypothetical protein
MTNSSPRLLIKNGTLIDGSGRDPIANSLFAVCGFPGVTGGYLDVTRCL